MALYTNHPLLQCYSFSKLKQDKKKFSPKYKKVKWFRTPSKGGCHTLTNHVLYIFPSTHLTVLLAGEKKFRARFSFTFFTAEEEGVKWIFPSKSLSGIFSQFCFSFGEEERRKKFTSGTVSSHENLQLLLWLSLRLKLRENFFYYSRSTLFLWKVISCEIEPVDLFWQSNKEEKGKKVSFS